MFLNNSDKSWKTLGQKDPYYGVLTHENYRTDNLDNALKLEFLKTGQKHVLRLVQRVEEVFGAIQRGRALDFGCGVGRLTIPLVEDIGFLNVVGIDVSKPMLDEANRNTVSRGISNVTYVASDDFLSQLEGTFDFIHSFIVLQHIPKKRGEKIIRMLIERLSPGGVAALQMPFYRNVSLFRKIASQVIVHVRPLHIITNIANKRPWNEPPMQMNRYDINKILSMLYDCGIASVTVEVLMNGGNLGAYFLIRKPL